MRAAFPLFILELFFIATQRDLIDKERARTNFVVLRRRTDGGVFVQYVGMSQSPLPFLETPSRVAQTIAMGTEPVPSRDKRVGSLEL